MAEAPDEAGEDRRRRIVRYYQTEPRSLMARNAAAAATNVRPIAAAVHRTIRDKFMRAPGCLLIESRVRFKSSTPPETNEARP